MVSQDEYRTEDAYYQIHIRNIFPLYASAYRASHKKKSFFPILRSQMVQLISVCVKCPYPYTILINSSTTMALFSKRGIF